NFSQLFKITTTPSSQKENVNPSTAITTTPKKKKVIVASQQPKTLFRCPLISVPVVSRPPFRPPVATITSRPAVPVCRPPVPVCRPSVNVPISRFTIPGVASLSRPPVATITNRPTVPVVVSSNVGVNVPVCCPSV
uniref:Uncharacterized protein n=1 Tax=Clytia hemisphaerica TaxID=252671 RepID=A0A7M5XAM6_9CNID